MASLDRFGRQIERPRLTIFLSRKLRPKLQIVADFRDHNLDPVRGRAGKVAALRAFMERLAPGRWDELRPPTDKEIAATEVMALPLVEVSAKVRSGGPVDAEADYAHPVWAGTVPVIQSRGEPVPDARLAPGIALPAYLRQGRG